MEGVVDKAGSVADVDIGVVDAHQCTVLGEDQNFESPENVNETFIQEDNGHVISFTESINTVELQQSCPLSLLRMLTMLLIWNKASVTQFSTK